MLPIILETTDETARTGYIQDFIGNHSIAPYHYFTYEPDGKEFSVKQVREIIAESSFTATEPRLFHLMQFDTASPEAQNAFLKTLEEHQPNFFYILSVENKGRLLPTIRSRSRTVSLAKKQLKSGTADLTGLLEKITQGDLVPLFELTAKSSLKTNPVGLLDSLLFFFRRRLADDPHAGTVLKEIITQRSLFMHNHLDPQTALDKILITVHKSYQS